MRSARSPLLLLGLALVAACASPQQRFARAVRRDVDGAAGTVFRTAARLDLTIIEGRIPRDSLRVWNSELTTAADVVARRADAFRGVEPPEDAKDVARVHAQLARALDDLAASLRDAARAYGDCARAAAADTLTQQCPPETQAALADANRRITDAGESLAYGRQRAARVLRADGVLLPPVDPRLIVAR